MTKAQFIDQNQHKLLTPRRKDAKVTCDFLKTKAFDLCFTQIDFAVLGVLASLRVNFLLVEG